MLPKIIRGFSENPGDNVIVLTLGTSFDTSGEAYDFYNLCFWDKRFGISRKTERQLMGKLLV